MTKDEIMHDFQESIDSFGGETYPAGMQGAIIGTLEKSCNGKDNRKLVLKQLTGKTSSKELNNAEWFGLYRLVQPWKPEGGKWGSGNIDLDRICSVLLNASVDQPGQTKMFVNYPEMVAVENPNEEVNWESFVDQTDETKDNWEPPF